MFAYFTKCKQYWDEYIVLVTPCACASTGSAMKLIERQQLMQFLMGLNDYYQGVRSNILMMNPLPSVSQASSIILQEEQQRVLKPAPFPINNEFAVFLSQQRTYNNQSKSFPSQSHLPRGNQSYSTSAPKRVMQQHNITVQCNYCEKRGHTIDKCYKLQRQRNERGLVDRGRRMASSMQHNDSGIETTANQATSQATG